MNVQLKCELLKYEIQKLTIDYIKRKQKKKTALTFRVWIQKA